MDEKTPHLHLCFTPITKDGRLSAKEIIGNRASLTKWQDQFWAYMVKAYPDLERGESASKTGRRHVPTRVFKEAVHLTKQAKAIETALQGINPINAGKKRDEVLGMLHTFFPGMEKLNAQMKKYKTELIESNNENIALKKEVNAGKTSIKDKMSGYQLQQDYDNLQRVYALIPEDIRREAETAARVKNPTKDRRQSL
jgi:hypothetical protein